MFKKIFAIAAVVGLAFTANVSTASAHGNNGYHAHHQGGWNGIPIRKIRNKLRHRGYSRIQFVDRYLPVYKARACKNGRRYKMNINRWGKVMWRTRAGWCGGYKYGYNKGHKGHYKGHHKGNYQKFGAYKYKKHHKHH